MPSRISALVERALYDWAHLQDLSLASASQACRLHALNLITGQSRGAKDCGVNVLLWVVFTSERQVWCEVCVVISGASPHAACSAACPAAGA